MAYVPGAEYDIFVSYAHADDVAPPGAQEGWVTTLVEGLKVCLGQKLGRQDAYSLWMDHELSRHESFSDEIVDSLRNTATCLVILSPAYLASEWCDRERETFIEAFRERQAGGARFFVVEREKLEIEARPEVFQQLLGYRFWVEDRGHAARTLGFPVPDPSEHAYFDLINDLGYDLAKLLKQLKSGEPVDPGEPAGSAAPAVSLGPPTGVAPDGGTIYLAEATDDIDSLREGTRRYFDQAGIRVLPDSFYPREPAAFQETVDSDLMRSDLFVQLLSELPGKRPPGLPQGYVSLQHERALELGKPVLQWRDRDLDVETVEDGDYRSLLDGETVLATGIEEFKNEIKQRLNQEPEKPPQPINAFVFVDVEQADQSVANEVCEALDAAGIGYALPMTGGKPAEIREDLQQNLLDCDALVVIYGGSSPSWVREQLRFFRKHLHQRETPLEVLTVLEGPPHEKDPLGYKLPRMTTLDCRNGVSKEDVGAFIDQVRERFGSE